MLLSAVVLPVVEIASVAVGTFVWGALIYHDLLVAIRSSLRLRMALGAGDIGVASD